MSEPKPRSLEQSARMWAMLTDISQQVVWHGQRLQKEDWKHVLSAALKKQRIVPNIDGDGFVVLGLSTSRMTVEEMSKLMEIAEHFGGSQGVKFRAAEEMCV